MKNIFAFILTIVGCFFLSACGGERLASIEPSMWVMDSIQSADNGTVIYCSANEKDNYAEADVRDIICNINGSTIEILNNETYEKWSGAYKIVDSDDTSSIYEATIDGTECQIVKSVTEYDDGTAPRNTLIISCEDYALNFFADE